MFIPQQLIAIVAVVAIAIGASGGAVVANWFANSKQKTLMLNYERERKSLEDQITKYKQESADATIRYERNVRAAEQTAREREMELERRIADLRGTSPKLRERVSTLIAAAPQPNNSETACSDIRNANAQLGRMVERIDEFAGRCSEAADRTTEALMLCRDYIKAIQE